MATFKPEIKYKRADGTYLVYIRCTHNKKNHYLKTSMYITSKQLSGREIVDSEILAKAYVQINKYIEKLNKENNIDDWELNEVIKFITGGDNKTPFFTYCNQFTAAMMNEGREKSASNYQCAVKSFREYIKKDISFQDITSKIINDWIKSLANTARAKESYPKAIKAIFDAGCLEYNDYDRNIIRIANRPFQVVKIPKATTPKKRAIPIEVIRSILGATPTTKRAEQAQDVAKLIVYLVGINTVDLYHLKKSNYKDGKLIYNRQKTKNSRRDEAYIEVAVVPEIQYLFEKYKTSDDRLFKFEYRDRADFNKYVNVGLKRICDDNNLGAVSSYAFRHSWATIAQNKCGASTELVAFCLNHASAHQTTEGYIEKNYTPIDVLNRKVIDYITGSEKGKIYSKL